MSVVTDEKHRLRRQSTVSASTSSGPERRRWLICTDGSPLSQNALRYAANTLARPGDQLVVLQALPDSKIAEEFVADNQHGTHLLDDHLAALVTSMEASAEGMLAASRLGPDWKEKVELVLDVRVGDPGPIICETAEDMGADAIVCSSRGLSGFQRFMLGSVSTYLVHHAPRPVVVVREDMS